MLPGEHSGVGVAGVQRRGSREVSDVQGIVAVPAVAVVAAGEDTADAEGREPRWTGALGVGDLG